MTPDRRRGRREFILLEVRALLTTTAWSRLSLRSDHDTAFFAEVIHEGGAHVRGLGAGDAVGTGVFLQPSGVNELGLVVGVGAVEKDDAVGKRAVGEHAEQVTLCLAGLGKDNDLLRAAQLAGLREGDAECLEERFALGVVGELKAKRAASTWWGFRSTCAPATAPASFSMLSEELRLVSS
jgi:hypothetical protein